MELLLMVLILLMLIGISNVIHRFLPFIPVPLIQITLGVTAAFMPKLHHVPLNPELFLVLFIAPLLFNDGMVIPRNELWNLRKYILLMALGLVFLTVLIAGSVHPLADSGDSVIRGFCAGGYIVAYRCGSGRLLIGPRQAAGLNDAAAGGRSADE
ncbi:cation:proton antiporter [Paenibacillus sp. TAB 01]|uniref:cation:proton antiporter domain-containing protein n=1 Tax=Paenibacillus sp. TAB 01 TaxID=3368988 RepID=UPI0037501AE6